MLLLSHSFFRIPSLSEDAPFPFLTESKFAPVYYHKTRKEGLQCKECHDSKIVRDIKDNSFKLVRWEKAEMKNVEGVIPALDGMKWDLVYLDRQDSSWIPLKNPAEPLLKYSGYCTPLTKEQFGKLSMAQGGQ